MACNVEQFLPSDDHAVSGVEDLVHASDLGAYPYRIPSRGRRFRPPRNMKLRVEGGASPPMLISAYQDRRQNVYIELIEGNRVLRELHTHEGHRNPGGELVPGTHMHFPSRDFPLRKYESSFAYPVEIELETVGEGVWYFCNMLGISTDGIQDFLG